MNKQESIHLAQQLLDSEFEDANHKPTLYCLAMGWSLQSPSTKKALSKQGKLAPTSQDINNLALIIESIGSDDTIEIRENNTVSDFLCNCVATHIIS